MGGKPVARLPFPFLTDWLLPTLLAVDQYDSGWGENQLPFLRRPAVRSVITLVVIVTFVMLTLMSTCSPRTTPIGTTTTTIAGVTV